MGNKYNSLPIGTERTNRYGYIEVKTDRRRKDGTVMWEGKHRIIWRETNGEIPIDKKIIFKDGDKTNLTLDNLQLVDVTYRSEKSKACCFKKGVKVWNAGLKGWNAGLKGWQAGGNSVKTQFKKGQLPKNTRKDGDERINVDGYTEVRVGKAKWMLKHRLVYQEHHKVELVTEQYVSFKDGNRQNFAIDNLELKSRAEMMAKNTLHQYPKDLQDVIRVLGKVKKTIKKKLKDGKDKV